jgi:hypothetical protein
MPPRLNNDLLEKCMQYLPDKHVLCLAMCNRVLFARRGERLLSFFTFGKRAYTVADALERVVNRPVLTRDNTVRGWGGVDIMYSWPYTVEVESDGLYVFGNFEVEGKSVMVKLIPNFKAKMAEHGWFEVRFGHSKDNSTLHAAGEYECSEKVDELLLGYRVHVNEEEHAKTQEEDAEIFEGIRESINEESERAFDEWDASGRYEEEAV